MKRQKSLFAALGLLAAWTAAARAQEPRWTFRLQGFASDISRLDTDDRYFKYHVRVKGKAGMGASIEARPGRYLGVELAGLWSHLDQHITTEYLPPLHPPEKIEEDHRVSLRILTVGFPIHLSPGGDVDLSITPLAGAALYGAVPPFHTGQNNPAYGLGLGLDWPFGNRNWALSGTARLLEADDEEIGLRPRWLLMRFFGLGISYRR